MKPKSPDLKGSKFITTAVIGALALKLLVSFTIDYGIDSGVNVALDVLMMSVGTIYIIANLNKIKRSNIRILIAIAIYTIYIIAVESFFGNAIEAIVYYSRFTAPILLYIMLISFTKSNQMTSNAKAIIYLITALSLLGLTFMPFNENHGLQMLPTYFSGLHKSSYIAAAALSGAIFLLIKQNKLSYSLLVCSVILLYFLWFGWGVRTALVFTLTFIMFWWILNLNGFAKIVALLLACIILPIAYIELASEVDLNQFSSGRLGMWLTKYDMFYNASMLNKLFGQGYGSDLVEIIGWWGEKDSHNNLIQITTEYGVFGLMIMLGTIATIYNSLTSNVSKALIIAYLSTTMISNGLAFRILPGYVFVLMLATIEVHMRSRVGNK